LSIDLRRRLDSAIRNLENDPYIGRPLRGELSGKHSLRIGDYRVIYVIDEDENLVILYTVKHRKKVYR